MPKLIIGLSGLPGCGKGAAAEILRDHYGASVFRFSAILTDVLQRLGIEVSRDNQIKLSEILRKGFGEDVLAYAMENDALRATSDLVVIDGFRRLEDVVALEMIPEFKLLEISAKPEVRFERMKMRGEKSGESDMTWEMFQAHENASTEITIKDVVKRAWKSVDNDGTKEDLERDLDAILKELGYTRP